MSFRGWPGFRVILLALAWILAVLVVTLWRAYWMLPKALDQGIAAVSLDIKWPIILALVPPLLLFALAFVAHRRVQR